MVFSGFMTGIHKDSVRRWNLWFSSAGVFAEVLAGGRQGCRIVADYRYLPPLYTETVHHTQVCCKDAPHGPDDAAGWLVCPGTELRAGLIRTVVQMQSASATDTLTRALTVGPLGITPDLYKANATALAVAPNL